MGVESCGRELLTGVCRRKTLEKDLLATPLKRSLTWWHLTFFGVGQMAGAGVYALTGTAVRTASGPATFISYILAGGCALLAALCYAEFGARCPKAGSAYTYTYITIGELLGFSIGWNLILEHVIGAASTARAWSSALNSITNNAVKNWTVTHIGQMEMMGKTYYPDLTCVIIIAFLTTFVVYGAEVSMIVTGVFTTINAITTTIIVACLATLADPINWSEPDGFTPHGTMGVISGSAMLFYSYVGFDAIAMAGEEVKDPNHSIPLANVLSIGIVMIFYVSMSIGLTLAEPYNLVDTNAAFAEVFRGKGFEWARITVSVTMLLVIQGSTICALFAGPRCAYSMAADGVLPPVLAYVNDYTRTPVVAIIFFSILSALAAVLIDLELLAEMVSLGTLLASYSVCACVIIMRYQSADNSQFQTEHSPLQTKSPSTPNIGCLKPTFKNLSVFNTLPAGKAVNFAILSLGILYFVTAGFTLLPASWTWYSITGVVLSCLGILISYLVILIHVRNETRQSFQIPLVPFLPSLTMFVIACLLVKLSATAWLRFIVWMTIGLVIYFTYGLWHSKERTRTGDYLSLDKPTKENDTISNAETNVDNDTTTDREKYQ